MTFCASYYILWRNRGGVNSHSFEKGGGSQKSSVLQEMYFALIFLEGRFKIVGKGGGVGGGGGMDPFPKSVLGQQVEFELSIIIK